MFQLAIDRQNSLRKHENAVAPRAVFADSYIFHCHFGVFKRPSSDIVRKIVIHPRSMLLAKPRDLVIGCSFDWHYQKGLLFETSSQTLQGQLFGEILPLAKVASKPCAWSVSDYQLRIQEKLNRKEKGLLVLQAQSYLHGVNLGALPSWGYAPGCHQALLQEGLLVLRGLYLAGFREFDSWYEKSCQILDWPYFLVNRQRIYQEVFAECVLLAEQFGSEETRKF